MSAAKAIHVGDSFFEGWYQSYCSDLTQVKQVARDAYAAGMSDPLAGQSDKWRSVYETAIQAFAAAEQALTEMASTGAPTVERTITGESWRGMPVAGYVWTREFEVPQGGFRSLRQYASHWSTGPTFAERLYRECDVEALLAAAIAKATGGAA